MSTLDQKTASLQDWMNAWVEGGSFPGMTLGIYNEKSEELFYHTVSHDHVYNRDTLYRIYSMTKPITVVGFLILLDRGLVSLDDEVSKFIPAFAQSQVLTGGDVDNYTTEPIQTPLKMVHLLTHTSGISYAIFGNSLNDQLLRKNVGPDFANWFHFTPLDQLVDKIAQSHLSFQPGSKYLYGLSIDVIGRVIEVISGLSLDVFFEKEIFQPLGMVNTFFQVPTEKLKHLAECYDVEPGSGHRYKVSTNLERERVAKPILLAGGGGLVSTLADYSKFACCLLNNGIIGNDSSKRLLKEETVTLMRQNHLANDGNLLDMSFDKGFSEAYGPGFGFGLGVSIIKDPHSVKGGSLASVGEYGWGGVAATSFFIDPVKKITGVFMTQLIPGAFAYPIRAQARWLVHSWFNAYQEQHDHKK